VFAYRIADARHAIFDPTGAMLHGGRWNSIGHRVIYAAATYAGALLEVSSIPISRNPQRTIASFESISRMKLQLRLLLSV
jgi:RES domain-containing protein